MILWAVVELARLSTGSPFVTRHLFNVVFAMTFEEAWYALAVVAAIVLALSLAALGSSDLADRVDQDGVVTYVARGRQLRLLARLAAVSASLISVDAVVATLVDDLGRNTVQTVESVVLLLVAYFLGAIAEDAGARSNPVQALELSLQNEVAEFELLRLYRARIFWRPSAKNHRGIWQIALLLPVSMLVAALSLLSLVEGLPAEAVQLLAASALLAVNSGVACGVGYLFALGVATRQSGVALVAAALAACFFVLPIAGILIDEVSGHSASGAGASIIGVLTWSYPWLVVACWLLNGRRYDLRRGKRDVMPWLSNYVCRAVDRAIEARRLDAPVGNRRRKQRWMARAAGWPLDGG